MRRTIAAVSIWFVFLIGCAASSTGNPLEEALSRYPELKGRPYTAAVVKRVVDGDTFELASGEKVRLIGVNTPETVKPNSPVEAYGKEASLFTKEKLTGKTVHLFADVGDKDRYGRLLRYVFVDGETEMYNMTMLLEGYANVMTVPPNVMFSKQFVEAERQARAANTGLWKAESKAGAVAKESSKPAEKPSGTLTTGVCTHPQIKGNINSKKEKIYHVPGGAHYDATKAEQLFCTEEEAIAAGFRKAAR